jgi:hypothetical protein
MTGATDEENLFKALTTASTILLKLGLFSFFYSFNFSLIVFFFYSKVKYVNLIV